MTPFRTVWLFILLALAGLATVPFLPVDYLPTPDSRTLSVTFSYPNRAPRVVEQEVTSVLENHLSKLRGLAAISSSSRQGSGYIELTFQSGEDMAFREMEARALLRQARKLLPEDIYPPRLQRNTTQDAEKSPLLVYEFRYSGDGYAASNWLNQQLLPRYGGLAGLDDIQLTGEKRYAWKVTFDEMKLWRLGLTPSLLLVRIQEHTGRKELGLLREGTLLLPVFQERKWMTSDELLSLPLGENVQLRDVAKAAFVEEPVGSIRRINGKDAILLSIYAHKNVSRIAVAQEIKRLSDAIGKELPQGYELVLSSDDTEFLRRELDKSWWRASLSLLVICLLVLLAERNPRYLILLILSILVSLAITLGVCFLIGLEFQLYTIAGITIALGIVIDNAIMIVYQLRHFGNIRILTAQLAAGISTIAALVVVFFLPETIKQELMSFALVIVVALCTSFFVSWWFTPALRQLLVLHDHTASSGKKISRWKVQLGKSYRHWIDTCARYRKSFAVAWILVFGIPVFLLPMRWEGQTWYNNTLGADKYQLEIKPWVNRLLGGSLRLFYQDVYESSSYRSAERTRLFMSANLPFGHTLSQMDHVVRYVENYIEGIEGVNKFTTNINAARSAFITIDFTEKAENTSFPYTLKNNLIQRSLDWGGVNWSVHGVGQGFSNKTSEQQPSFRVLLKGFHYDQLSQWADALAIKLMEHRRITSVDIDAGLSWWSPAAIDEYRFVPLARAGLADRMQASMSQVAILAPQLAPATRIRRAGVEFPLYLEEKSADKFSLHDLFHTGVQQPALAHMGKIEKVKTNSTVTKEERQYLRVVAFQYNGSHHFGDKYLDEVLASFEQKLPQGFSAEKRQWTWGKQEEKRKYGMLLVLMVAIFFIGTMFTERFWQGLLVVLIVPLSFIGIFLGFSWGNFPFDQGGYASFLLVGGLSVNAVLYLLNDYNRLTKTLHPNRALVVALRKKTWPVVLTVVSTCLGLVPFLMYGASEVFWFSFAIGTISGLVFSLLIAFWVLPVLLWKVS